MHTLLLRVFNNSGLHHQHRELEPHEFRFGGTAGGLFKCSIGRGQSQRSGDLVFPLFWAYLLVAIRRVLIVAGDVAKTRLLRGFTCADQGHKIDYEPAASFDGTSRWQQLWWASRARLSLRFRMSCELLQRAVEAPV